LSNIALIVRLFLVLAFNLTASDSTRKPRQASVETAELDLLFARAGRFKVRV
jgi:hypothetical protein